MELRIPASRSAPDAAVLARLQAAAGESLAVWPEARAAVLFGSRARGDHRPSSDWDIAFITDGDDERCRRVPDGLPLARLARREGLDLQIVALPDSTLRRNACAIGTLAVGLLRDGCLLAGSWTRYDPEGATAEMEPRDYRKFVNNAGERMERAAREAAALGKLGDWSKDDGASDNFAAETANAAEHLAKAMLGRHGINYEHTHDLSVLAGQADRADLPDLGVAIRSMNGLTKGHHVGAYPGPVSLTASDLHHAVGRFHAVLPLLAAEVAAAEADARLAAAADDGRLRRAALDSVREGRAALEAALAEERVFETAPEPFINEKVAVLTSARPALVSALGDLEAALDPPDLSTPSPFC